MLYGNKTLVWCVATTHAVFSSMTGLKLQTGHWQAEEAVQACETDLRHKSIIGYHQRSHHGLGYIKSSKVPSDKSLRDYRTFISGHHNKIDDTYAISKTVQLKVQSQWTRWLKYIQQNFSWKLLLAMLVNLSSFSISSIYDTLPSPSNLKRWKLTAVVSCFLCNKDILLHLTFLVHVKLF